MVHDIRRPNFFIVGAPKCGTTSLAAWLAEHPQVYMSAQKEPNHFNTDFKLRETPDRKEYEGLFAPAISDHAVIGEATTRYLYSSDALINIMDYNPDSRIIAMVRNPTEMAISLHSHRVFSEKENTGDFERAWRLQADREKGLSIPPLCDTPEFLQYGPVCRLGEQVKRLCNLVPRHQRHVVVLDDVKKDPLKEWKVILHFLGIDDDRRSQFPIHNRAKKIRSRYIRLATRAVAHAKEAAGLPRFRLGLLKRVDSLNRRHQANARISVDLQEELREYFRDDIELLGDILERDFSGWLTRKI